ncbi:MAG: sulfotransferase family protein [Gammaproteobacteria bacterium]|nr:sulfotransferase family protein [Gammaproteobacteria bacterium]MCF6230413.1 sulfotransferase family protein [Gammaproteobacteria bacterium]
MLLSHRYQFLFVHIAKTGGTSVRAALVRKAMLDPYRLPMWCCSKLSHLTRHKLASKLPRHSKIIAAKEMLPKEFFDSLFKFGFVRNPWDLQVSSFHHIKRERPQYLFGHDNFKDFLKFKFDPKRPYQYHIDTSIELQSDYLVDLHGNIIVDYIGRYENFHNDFSHVCEKIKIKCALPEKRISTDRTKDFRNYYDDESVELVARHFKRDIELLDYCFE